MTLPGYKYAIEHALARRDSLALSDGCGELSHVDLSEDREWLDAESDVEETRFQSFLDGTQFPDMKSLFEYDRRNSFIDFPLTCRTLRLDYFETIKLVNYLRSEAKAGNFSPNVSRKNIFTDEKYLKPVLEDDALLYHIDELSHLAETAAPADETHRLAELQFVDADQQAFRQQTCSGKAVEQKDSLPFNRRDLQGLAEDVADPSRNDGAGREVVTQDDDYFFGYGKDHIHEVMIKDAVRTGSYHCFIEQNRYLFEGKLVLDVGCGTGILSLMCAQAGARHVVAVDNAGIIEKAKEIARDNGFANTITFMRGDLDRIELPHKAYDIIVSEWMGYGLLYEGMLPTVLQARDKYLAPGGLMVPSHATIHVAGVSDSGLMHDEFNFWRDVYGFDLTRMVSGPASAGRLADVRREALVTDVATTWVADLTRLSVVDVLGWRRPFDLSVVRDAADGFHGFALWFDIYFTSDGHLDESINDASSIADKTGIVAFTTGPSGEWTHWQQTFLPVPGKEPGRPLNKGQTIKGSLGYEPVKNRFRDVRVFMKWIFEGSSRGEGCHQKWELGGQ